MVYSFGVSPKHPSDRVLEQIRNYVRPGARVKIMVIHRILESIWILRHGKGQLWRPAAMVERHRKRKPGCPVTYHQLHVANARNCWKGADSGQRRRRSSTSFRIASKDYVPYRSMCSSRSLVDARTLSPRNGRCLGWHLCVTAED